MALLIWFVHHTVMDSNMLLSMAWNSERISGFLALLTLYVGTLVIGSLVWYRQLETLQGSPIAVSRVLAISLTSQLAKYLPGNVAHHVGRAVLAGRSGIPAVVSLFSILLETFWVMAVAASLGLVFVLWFWGSMSSERLTGVGLTLLAVGMVAAAAAPHLLHRQWTTLSQGYLIRHGVSQTPLNPPTWRLAVVSMSCYLLIYMMMGLVISLLGWLFFSAQLQNVLLLGSAFALAWVVGFISPGSPAGLGIREVILLQVLSPLYGNETASATTALLRLLTVTGDALGYLLGLLILQGTVRAAAGRS
jgi:hypothetical protein